MDAGPSVPDRLPPQEVHCVFRHAALTHLLPPLVLTHQVLQLVGQVGVFSAQFVVASAVQLDLSLDLRQHVLEVTSDLLPLLLILPAALQGLLLQDRAETRQTSDETTAGLVQDQTNIHSS